MKREPLMALEYMEGNDGMLYPKLQISENEEYDRINVGIYGKRWKEYMMENYPHRLSILIAEGRINEMIYKVDRETEERKEGLIQRFLLAQPLPETEDSMERASHMKMITMQAEEIIMRERALLTALIKEIHVYEEEQANGQWLKSIIFRLPIVGGNMDISLDNDVHVESVIMMRNSGLKGK